jgi:nicotinamidase-related amidase
VKHTATRRTAQRTALLLVDVINDLDFEGGAALRGPALAMADALRALVQEAHRRGVPVVYVNDNKGRWRSDREALVRRCLRPRCRGRALVAKLRPSPRDYFVVKPAHGGFYQTTLEVLLRWLGVRRVIITGLATDRCVAFTAYEAYVRDLRVAVPRNCCAAEQPEWHAQALDFMERVVEADTRPLTPATWKR